jgi:hypothetical protein
VRIDEVHGLGWIRAPMSLIGEGLSHKGPIEVGMIRVEKSLTFSPSRLGLYGENSVGLSLLSR